MNRSTFEDELEKNGYLVYTNTGDSMFPLIRMNGDLVVIKKSEGPYKKYDVPLYKRPSGQYVLHRIVKVTRDGGYIICGDNRRIKEKGIEDSNIIGVLSSVIRNGKEIKCHSKPYLVYSRVWNFLFPIRSFFMFFRDLYLYLIKKR